MAGPSNSEKPDPIIGEAVGKRLKAFYHEIASEPPPERFLALLDELRRAEESHSQKDASGEEGGRE